MEIRLNTNIALAEFYREYGTVEKAEEAIQEINNMTAELDPNSRNSLKLQLNANFALAEFYREYGQVEKADDAYSENWLYYRR